MSAPAPPAPLPFPPHSCPTDASFWPPNQELWPTQQDLEPFSRFTTDFPQFPQLEIHPNEPPFKKSRSSEEPAPSNSNLRTVPSNPPQRFHNHFQGDYGPEKNRGISRMFFKTKLCCKFQLGICPYSTNCNFAHGNQEIRKPPPNWQEIVAAHEDDRQLRSERREDIHTPFLPPSEYQRISKLRICKKFYSGEGCPYGDRCTFLHEDPDRARESIAITTNSSRCGPDPIESTNGFVNSNNGDGPNGLNQKPVYWKTRFCNKWETTGHCPFGDKCHFAHGLADLQNYGGSTELGNGNSGITPLKPVSNSADDISPNQRSSKQEQRQSHGSFPKLKGSTKINWIYADWIDDNDLDLSMHTQFGEQS